MAKIIARKNNSNVIITQGETGFVAYLKEMERLVIFTKDKNKNFVDAIGAGDTFLAGFVSYLAKNNTGELPALVYADIVAHLSTSQLGTIDVVTAESADKEYKNAKTFIKEVEDTLHVHRTIDNV
jgi:sugar/nucleoside kinase (ribokinase family)